MKRILLFLLFILFSFSAYSFELKSKAFNKGESIPAKYTCDGDNISPDLYWVDVPDSTESFAIICKDPDAPGGTFIHWMIYNIPYDYTNTLAENVAQVENLPNGAIQTENDFGKIGYSGPCPPAGKPHRYIFEIYALEIMLPVAQDATRDDIMQLIRRHYMGEVHLEGLYSRQ